MATIRYSALITEIRGKYQGSQFSKNRSGALLQNKCMQRKGATTSQSNYRSLFSTLARYWRTLSEDDQIANADAALNYPYTDKYGQTRYFTGYQLLLRSNINRAVSGLEPISVVPATPPAGYNLTDVEFLSTVIPGVAGDCVAVWTAPSAPPSDYSAQLFIGNQVSSAIQNYTGAYLAFGYIDAAIGEYSVDQDALPAILTFIPGNAVFLKLVVIHAPSGIEVSSYTAKAIIVEV